jgi:hypothetical protein
MRSAPEGQRPTWASTSAALAPARLIHGFFFTSKTAGRPFTQRAECVHTFGSKVTTSASLS